MFRSTVLFAILAFVLTVPAFADVPTLINYQGRLTDDAGAPISGDRDMTFEFYDAATGGSPIPVGGPFSETQTVTITDAVFNVLIGSSAEGAKLPAVFNGATDVYLSVTVDGEQLGPRQRVVSVGFALNASHATTADNANKLGGEDAADLLARLARLEGRVDYLVPPMEMCTVAAGTFICSNPPGNNEFPTTDGTPVYLDAYEIGKHEVTNAEYCTFLNAGGNDDHWHSSVSAPPHEQQIIMNGPGSYSVTPGLERHPVRHVSWYDAVAFCQWRSEVEGLEAPHRYRLPTEAEWEKAAGWGPTRTGRLWYYGMSSDSVDCDKANYNNCVSHTAAVGSYPANDYGCHDMSGNVFEWCADWFGNGTYPSSADNPAGPQSGTGRVLRGGSWGYGDYGCRVSFRGNGHPAYWAYNNGFRCARTLE